MLKAELTDELKLIAYSNHAVSKSRVAALTALYKMGQEPSRIVLALEEIAAAPATPDLTRIKAVELLHRIDTDIGDAPVQHAIDIENVKNTLVEQYCGEGTGQS